MSVQCPLFVLPLHAGMAGWGIAWFINESFVPVIRVTRGYTYTFFVYGGQVSSLPARYHPFYITDSATGGRLANSPEEVKTYSQYMSVICIMYVLQYMIALSCILRYVFYVTYTVHGTCII